MEDRRLLEAIAGGDEQAFDRLYERFQGDVTRHVGGIVRDLSTTQDVVQEVFLRVLQRAGQYDGRGSLRAWLMRTATNVALNTVRSARRRRQTPLEGYADPDDPGYQRTWMIDEADQAPDCLVERAEEAQLLSEMLDALDPDRRRLMRMVHEEEMDLRAVAQELDLPIGTVKSRLYYTRRQIAQTWADRLGRTKDTP